MLAGMHRFHASTSTKQFPRPLADHQVPGLAREFVEHKGGEILKQGLVKNLILHLTNLHR